MTVLSEAEKRNKTRLKSAHLLSIEKAIWRNRAVWLPSQANSLSERMQMIHFDQVEVRGKKSGAKFNTVVFKHQKLPQ